MVDPSRRNPIRVPNLGIEDARLTVSVWLVPRGASVAAGDRVVEVSTGEAVVDLPSPTHGVLVEKLIAEDAPVQTGQVLGWIQPAALPP
ncbi:MAG: lipoyl domain-containing protein [Planctomycetota bacterium]